MGEHGSPLEHGKEKFVWDAPAKQGAVAVALAAALLLTGVVMSPKKGPATGKLTTPAVEGTEEIQRVTGTVRDAILTTQGLKDVIEDARVKALFNEAENEKKTDEEIFAMFKQKIKKDPNYTPTREERIALAQLGIAVNDGAPIPYEGDGKEEEEK